MENSNDGYKEKRDIDFLYPKVSIFFLLFFNEL